MSILHLFTGDLRIDDNPGLSAAFRQGAVLGGLLLTPWHERGGDLAESAVCELKSRFLAAGGTLIIRAGHPAREALRMLEAGACDTVTVTKPRHGELDTTLDAVLYELSGLNVSVRRFDDVPTVSPYPLLNDWGRPASGFQEFKRLLLGERERPHSKPRGSMIPSSDLSNALPIPPTTTLPSPARLFRRYVECGLAYAGDPAREFVRGGSGLGPSLRFGLLSTRTLIDTLLSLLERRPDLANCAERFLDRVLLGEFCRHTAAMHGPEYGTVHDTPDYAIFPFENRRDRFDSWTVGETGAPAVDAAMRELSRHGRIPHPLREIAAAWLIQVEHMDWRLVDRYFRTTLLDYDPAISAWHLQRLAGCGTGIAGRPDLIDIAARYRTIDPDADFVRRRLPELRDATAGFIHHLNSWIDEAKIDPVARQALYLKKLRETG